MKDYIVTTTVNHFDATKFDFDKFYIVEGYGTSHRCLLRMFGEDVAHFTAIVDGKDSHVVVNADEVASGKVVIKEVETLDDVVPLSKSMPEYKDLYDHTCDIKTGRCYVMKVGDLKFSGFCSYRNESNITMVIHSNLCHIACVTYDPTIYGEWKDNIKSIRFPSDPSIMHNSITNGTVMTIDLNEIKEGRILFREMV